MDWHSGAIADARWWADRLRMHIHPDRAQARIEQHAVTVARERGHTAVTPGDVERACVWTLREVEGGKHETVDELQRSAEGGAE